MYGWWVCIPYLSGGICWAGGIVVVEFDVLDIVAALRALIQGLDLLHESHAVVLVQAIDDAAAQAAAPISDCWLMIS